MTSNPYLDDAASAIPGVPHRWTALTIALTVIGFVVFWPLGVAMILYVLCGEKIMAWARSSESGLDQVKRAAGEFGKTFGGQKGFGAKGFGGFGPGGRTGNVAFDAWREAELKRLDEERRKLEETTAAFEAHLRAERGAYDDGRQREEFERFMAARGGAAG